MAGFADYVTAPPPGANGASMLSEALKAIAQRKLQMQMAEMQDAQRREAERLQSESRANTVRESRRHSMSTEEQARNVLGETGRHNLSTEDIGRQTVEQRRASALSNALMAPGTQSALQGTDAGQLDAIGPALAPLGVKLRSAGPGVDDTIPMGGEKATAQAMDRRELVGPGGSPMMTFDPAMNAVARARRATELSQKATQAAEGMGGYDAGGMKAGGRAGAFALEMGASPEKAAEATQRYATSSSGQATSRANASQIAASKTAGAAAFEPYRKNAAIENFVKSVEAQDQIPKIRETAASAAQMRNLLRSPTGVKDTVAMAQLGRSLFGAAQSNAEGQRLLNSGGLGTRIANALTKIESGQFSPEFRKDLDALAASQESAARTRIARAGLKAQKLARQHGIIGKVPGADEYVRGRITGQVSGPQVELGGAGGGTSSRSIRLGGEPAVEAGDEVLDQLLNQE